MITQAVLTLYNAATKFCSYFCASKYAPEGMENYIEMEL